jgi:16S rRNA (guanine1207-N2)-methyltransferase
MTGMLMVEDIYFKKVVPFNFSRQRLRFRASQDLFSSQDVDVGTRFLLRTLTTRTENQAFQRVLDLGCGYGPIGLTLKAIDQDRLVHLTDRDALAIEYSRQNAALNNLTQGTEIYGSLGYDDLRRSDFDLIVSNIPGKAGEPVIASLLRDAGCYLAPDGLAAVVVVSPLEQTVANILGAPEIDVVWRESRSGHAVFHYRFSDKQRDALPCREDALDRGVYQRATESILTGGVSFHMQTAYGLPEFDTPSYATQLLIDGIRSTRQTAVHRAVVFNPGQGHAAVSLWKLIGPSALALVGRDLLALRNTSLNLARNGCPSGQITRAHQVGIRASGPEEADLVVGVLREDEGPDAAELTIVQGAQQLSPRGMMVVAGSSTAITRLVTFLEPEQSLEIVDRRRHRGHSALILRATRENERASERPGS